MITGKEMDPKLADIHLALFFSGAVIMGLSMGLAGVAGMLRRTLYFNGEYFGYMAVAAIGGVLMGIGFLVFLLNFIRTYGFRAVVAVFK